ncbi:MAG: DUF2092 domain-containing protein [Thermodesulfobacteriota bacterium]
MINNAQSLLKKPSIVFLSILITVMSAGYCSFSPSKNALAQDVNPNIDPKAAGILQDMSYYMGSQYEYTYKAEMMFDDVLESKQKIMYNAEETVYLKKPDKFYVGYVTDLGGYKLWYDAGQATLLEVPLNDFSLATLPGTVDQALNKLKEQYQFTPALSEFLFIDTYKVMTADVISGAYFGMSKVMGANCHHLVFVEKDIDWQIWIEDGKRPVPRKLVITYKNMAESPQFIALIKDWVFGKPITNFAFKPEIPDVNSRVEFDQITENQKYKIGSIRAFQ